jgi:hypothetical protein
MAGEGTGAGSALHRLRARWLAAPSPPLAVDVEPHWIPSADPAGDQAPGEGENERPDATVREHLTR